MPWTKTGRELRARVEELDDVRELVKDVRRTVQNTQIHTAAVASLLSTQNTELSGHRAGLDRVAAEIAALREGEDKRWREFAAWMGEGPPAVFETPAQRGQRAFEAYRSHAGGTAVTGRPIPPWDEIGDQVQAHWIATAAALDVDR